MKDRELIEQMEALEEVLEWLEEKDTLDMEDAAETIQVDESEVEDWLSTPELQKVRDWLKR